MRGTVAFVLVGYGMTLVATSAGHGFRLVAHLAGEHHERLEALLFGPAPSAAHGHEAEPSAGGFHAHHGLVHSHHEAPPPPALVTITLDKHCLASRPAVPAPREQRLLERAAPFGAPAVVVHPVEVRPPERLA